MSDDQISKQPSVQQLSSWNALLSSQSPEAVLGWAAEQFPDAVAFASSLGAEDQLIIRWIAEAHLNIRSFTLDTGRLFPETYSLLAKTANTYDIPIEVYVPETTAVEKMVFQHGIDLFFESVEKRKLCCDVRKSQPLNRALKSTRAWITGLRGSQSNARQNVQVIEWDAAHNLVKINPLWNWSEEQVWQLIHEAKIPYNPLHDQGFPSIGCASCTRAVQPGEDLRAGRWWWEQESHKECGLHAANLNQKNKFQNLKPGTEVL